jgi:hypothetical protein
VFLPHFNLEKRHALAQVTKTVPEVFTPRKSPVLALLYLMKTQSVSIIKKYKWVIKGESMVRPSKNLQVNILCTI